MSRVQKSCLVCDSGELNNAFVPRASGSYQNQNTHKPPLWIWMSSLESEEICLITDLKWMSWGWSCISFYLNLSVPVSSSICWYWDLWIIIPEFQSSFWIITSSIHSVVPLSPSKWRFKICKSKRIVSWGLEKWEHDRGKINWKVPGIACESSISGHPQSEQSAFCLI